MAHPDAMATFLSGGGEINNHFTSPPFAQKELEKSGITKVLNSVDVLGGPISFNVVAATSKFHGENPKLYAVFVNRSKRQPSLSTKTSALPRTFISSSRRTRARPKTCSKS
jgi:hypothetical protein